MKDYAFMVEDNLKNHVKMMEYLSTGNVFLKRESKYAWKGLFLVIFVPYFYQFVYLLNK